MSMTLVPFLLAASGASMSTPDIDGFPVERCLALFSTELRKKITTISSLEREVVLIPESLTVGDIPALSAALNADIVPLGDGWSVFRRDATLKRLRDTDQKWVKKQADATILRLSNLFKNHESAAIEAPFKVMKAARARFEATQASVIDTSGIQAQEVTPAARLLIKLLEQIPPEAYGEVVPGTIAVFSNFPVGLEKRLTVDASTIKSYTEAQKKFVEWSTDALAQEKIPPPYRWAFPSRSLGPGARTVHLRVDRRDGEPTFALQIFDPFGRREAGLSLTARSVEGLGAPPKVASSRLGIVSLRPETLAVVAKTTPGTPTFRIESLDPVAQEPLAVNVGGALCLYARAKGFDRIVACVPDALISAVPACIDGSSLNLDALAAALDETGCESLAMGKTLVVRPKHTLEQESFRVDRRPLSTLFIKASKGKLGVPDILSYHASYAAEYEHRPVLKLIERRIVNAFSLQASPNWSLPHPMLATLGKMTRAELQIIAAGDQFKLVSPNFSKCLFPLAQLAGGRRGESTDSDLERTPTHLLARPEGCWLEGSAESQTLVRRVSKGYAERNGFDSSTGISKVEKGENLVLDDAFLPLRVIVEGLPESDAHRILQERYRFFWVEQRITQVRATFGKSAQAGPITFRESLRESKSSVPLDQVPGLYPPRSH